jgi:hypothetical protein
MKQIDGIARYLSQLDSADRQGPTVPEASLYEALAPADFGCLAQEKTVSCCIVDESSPSGTTRSCFSATLLTR